MVRRVQVARRLPGRHRARRRLRRVARPYVASVPDGASRGGDQRPRSWELAGVEMAEPPPPITADSTNIGITPPAMHAMPIVSSTSATWLMRSGP